MEDIIFAGSVLLTGGIFVVGAICIDWYKKVFINHHEIPNTRYEQEIDQ